MPQVYSTTRVCVLQHWVLSGHLCRSAWHVCAGPAAPVAAACDSGHLRLCADTRVVCQQQQIVILMTGQAGRQAVVLPADATMVGELVHYCHVASLHAKQHSLTLCMGAALSFHFE